MALTSMKDLLGDSIYSVPGPKPTYTRHRPTNPETSVQAARAVRGKITEIQKSVLQALWLHPQGMTDLELEHVLGRPGKSSVRTRRSELTDNGLVEDSGKRLTLEGRARIVWQITDLGRAAV